MQLWRRLRLAFTTPPRRVCRLDWLHRTNSLDRSTKSTQSPLASRYARHSRNFEFLILNFETILNVLMFKCFKIQSFEFTCLPAGRFQNSNFKIQNSVSNVMRHERLLLFVSIWFQILFHPPHRGTFHLSLTVLVRYRSEIIFSLGSVVLPDSDRISPVPPYLRINASGVFAFRIRGYYPLWLFFPEDFTKRIRLTPVNRVHLPRNPTARRLGLDFSAFARHYLRNHNCFLFLLVLRCFNSQG